jgi:alpha,alpha-trehalase
MAEAAARQMYRDLASAAESGWDFSSRWLRCGDNLATIRTTHIIPVELNTFLWNLEKVLLKLMKASGDLEGCRQVCAYNWHTQINT